MSIDHDLKKLDDLNEVLDSTIKLANNSLSLISELEDYGQTVIQNEVDTICLKVSDKANTILEEARDQTVATLHEKYVSANKIVQQLEPIVNAKLSDLGSVISVLTKIISLYAKPYKEALDYTVGFVGVATPKLMETADKVAYLASLKDQIPIPDGLDINFDKLSIKMPSISIGDIISG